MKVTLPLPFLSDGQLRRFWAKVDRSGGPDVCHEWQGARWKKGYGLWSIRVAPGNDRILTAHRVAYILTYGEPPADLYLIRHSCDNPPCCNPRHLLPGTDADNAADRDKRGRCRAGAANAAKTHCPQGHLYEGGNLAMDAGGRKCRECLRERQRQLRRTRATSR